LEGRVREGLAFKTGIARSKRRGNSFDTKSPLLLGEGSPRRFTLKGQGEVSSALVSR